MAYQSIYITSNKPSVVAGEIRRSLANGPNKLAATAKEGEVELRILSEVRERSILSLSTNGTVLEFQLRLRISYQLTDGGDEPVIAATELVLNRSVSYSDATPTAKASVAPARLLNDFWLGTEFGTRRQRIRPAVCYRQRR